MLADILFVFNQLLTAILCKLFDKMHNKTKQLLIKTTIDSAQNIMNLLDIYYLGIHKESDLIKFII